MPENNNTQQAYVTLPNSVESERNLLCCILRNTDMQLEIISQLEESDFYQKNHQEIFAAMKRISAQNLTVNFATVVDALRRNKTLAQVGDIDYITLLNDALPGTARFEEYLKIVKRASTMRRLIDICGEVTKRAYSTDSSESAITYAEERIFELSQKGSASGLVELSTQTARTLVKITERYENPDKFHGLETGFRRLDNLTNGFHGGELIVLAARPGGGKSAMMMNIVENIAKNGGHVAIYSLEMSNEQLLERLLSAMSGVPLGNIKSGRLERGEQDIHKLQIANNLISETMHLYGNDNPNVRPAEILSQCRRLKMQKQLDMIVVDYIGLMQSDRDAESRQNEVANITRSFKIMAKELNVPVLALSQLKRDTEIRNIKSKGEGASEPVLSDLRESGAIEQDADIVMFIHRENTEDKSNEDVSLIVAKHRNGETDKIPLKWIGSNVRFVNPDYLSQGIPARKPVKKETPEKDIVMTDESNSESEFIMSDADSADSRAETDISDADAQEGNQ
ncbi:MAG: replicative DNA helicase [Corallococcus sp.]|nr:replicative DNA helicase [Corallococcus sp.]